MPTTPEAITVGAALVAARAVLPGGGSAHLDARLLLGAILERNSAWLFAHEDAPLAAEDAERYRRDIARRAAGEPVAYILGEAGFYGRRFGVSPAVLVPRPETELLVTLALAALRPRAFAEPFRLCDVGTGSGILAITLAAELPLASVVAIDVSAEALSCAERNARSHGVRERIAFVRGDVLEAVAPHERFACIVANLPYVRARDVATKPDPTAFEPRLALDGGTDGLAVYRKLLARAPGALEPEGTLLMEAGPDTAAELAALAREAFGGRACVSVARDYAYLERVVTARPPGERSPA